MLRLVRKLQVAAMNLSMLGTSLPTRLGKDKKGVTMLEYALIAALVAIAAVTILSTLGTTVSSVFSKVNANMSSA
jgi:pilus assembly protein Flp/PilA